MNNTFINNVTRLAFAAAGALTGGSAGAAIGTMILPGAGTAIGYLFGTGLAGINSARKITK
ncbi:hypothetical protein [Paenibacillus sp. AD87]|uniref:hypothetical protein n=1 Tax=Paenibacillus sp. AD87 TaxID=1528787 RepID=UPI0007E4AC6E|nr:hypothetical protein [Paenibacillus sp. AD87]OAX49902.1 hypothetical protein gpAD87_17050 [Paenibacillus sp. AD87]